MKKTAIQNFKLSEEKKKEFNDLCEQHDTTASHELRQFVNKRIKQFKEKSN